MLSYIIFQNGGITIIIYKITCQINQKIYIGQTSEDLRIRFSRHTGYQRHEHDTKFYRAINKYGAEQFSIEQIDSATTQEELDEKEVYWIKQFDSINLGYNTKSSKGKCGGDTLSNHPNKEAISQKIRLSKLGDKNPMRKNGGLRGSRNGMFGKFGKEAPSARKCVALSKLNDEVLTFDTLSDLKNYFQVTTLGMVSSRCSGRTKAAYKGYYFKYYEDYIESQSTIESVT